jgi:hypothetical protein
MDVSVTLVNLAGAVALLLWGVHMVQTGVQRALGARLRAAGDRAAQPLAGVLIRSIRFGSRRSACVPWPSREKPDCTRPAAIS